MVLKPANQPKNQPIASKPVSGNSELLDSIKNFKSVGLKSVESAPRP
jgi:hypothetical protein